MARTTRSSALQSHHAAMVDLFGKGAAPIRRRIKNFNEKMASPRYAWELFAKEAFPNRGYFIAEQIGDGKDIKVNTSTNMNIVQLLKIAKIRKEYPDLRDAQEKIKHPSWALISGEATLKEIETKYVTLRDAKATDGRNLDRASFGMTIKHVTSGGGIALLFTAELLEYVFGENYIPANYSTKRNARLTLPSGALVVMNSPVAFSEDYYYSTNLIDRTKWSYIVLCREILDCILAKVPSMKLATAKYLRVRKERVAKKQFREEGLRNLAVLSNIQKLGISTYMTLNVKEALRKAYMFESRDLEWFESTKKNTVGMTMKLTGLKPTSMQTFGVNVRAYFSQGYCFIKEDIFGFLGLDSKSSGYNPTTNIWYYDTPFTQGAENIRIKEKYFSDGVIPEFKRLAEEVFFIGRQNSLLVVERVGLVELRVHYIWFFQSLAFTVTYTLELGREGYSLV